MSDLKPHHQDLKRFIDASITQVREVDHPVLIKEWLDDSPAIIQDLLDLYQDDVDMAILASSGEWSRSLLDTVCSSEYSVGSLPHSSYNSSAVIAQRHAKSTSLSSYFKSITNSGGPISSRSILALGITLPPYLMLLVTLTASTLAPLFHMTFLNV